MEVTPRENHARVITMDVVSYSYIDDDDVNIQLVKSMTTAGCFSGYQTMSYKQYPPQFTLRI